MVNRLVQRNSERGQIDALPVARKSHSGPEAPHTAIADQQIGCRRRGDGGAQTGRVGEEVSRTRHRRVRKQESGR